MSYKEIVPHKESENTVKWHKGAN